MRPAIASILTVLLAWSATAQNPQADEMRARVVGIGQGYLAEVRLTAGDKLTGRIGEIKERDFVLEEVRERKLQDQTIAFAELKSVRTASARRRNHAAALAIMVAGSIGMSILIRFLRRR
jgi:hypothetical protein